MRSGGTPISRFTCVLQKIKGFNCHNPELNRVEQSRTTWSGSIIGKINHTTPPPPCDYFFDQYRQVQSIVVRYGVAKCTLGLSGVWGCINSLLFSMHFPSVLFLLVLFVRKLYEQSCIFSLQFLTVKCTIVNMKSSYHAVIFDLIF